MHVGDSVSPTSTLDSPRSSSGRKDTFVDEGNSRSQSLEQEKNVFGNPLLNSPVLEATELKHVPEVEGLEIEPKNSRYLNVSEAVPGLVAVTSYEYERYFRNVITCVPDSWRSVRIWDIKCIPAKGISGTPS
jgi:hypothetical protein